jgi:hypothetical protein
MSPLSSSQPHDAVAAEKPDNTIVRAAIHPSIGVARVGNSVQSDGFFIGPELVDPPPAPPGFYRDSAGALKRQAARFRIYGLNTQGQVVQELTPANAEIVWQVHLANKKAAWYQFQVALDIPESNSAPVSYLRNMAIPDRDNLAIDPGSRSIAGVNAGGPNSIFDTGKFMGKQVYLGEIRTDHAGRLVVLGGYGKSASCDGTPAVTFANNEGWHDDISDGPVTASVKYGGQVLPVDPAWVVVGPPNYGPCQKSVRTMWDLMRDTAIKAKMLASPACPSFDKELRPIFERLSNLQWVNVGIGAGFGWNGPNHFAAPEWLKRLADKSHSSHELRRTIANQFRNFDRDSWSPTPWPWQYGDAMNVPAAHSPRQNVALSDTQLGFLEQWAKGDFVSDYDPSREPYTKIEDVPLAEQPDVLDRAALEFCLADAFHPGCEMTWPMRQKSLYKEPFRIKHAESNSVEPQYGPVMDAGVAMGLLPAGPLGPQYPGGLTRWMAVPWQTDTASCRAGYEKRYDPHLPTFWPARVPNQVLTNASYEIVMNKSRPLADRLAAFARRSAWPRPLGLKKGYLEQINRMITNFGDMGVVEHRDGPGDPEFPSSMEVEDLHAPVVKQMAAAMPEPDAAVDETDLTGIDKVRRFPYGLRK